MIGTTSQNDNELVIDLFRGSLTRSIQEKFERNPPGKRWEWYREVEEIDRQRMLLQQSSARHSLPNATSPPLRTGSRPNQSSIPIRQPTQPYPARSPSQATTQATIQNLNRPLPHHPTQPSKQGSPAPSGINTCHVCKGIGHWARDCPSRRVNPLSSRPMGPKVMVTTADPFEEATDSGDGHTGSTETGDPCHGPGCSRSRRVMGSYGRSTGIEDLVDTSREHGRSAVSMETTDSYGFTCKGEPSHMRGGPGTATRRTKLKEQAQPRGGPSEGVDTGHEEEEQCRRSRHRS
ncbi:hypothetical protein NDA10_001332 [Ustilago hordei]|nr:hypothetical protein NDA10_001332 [Ustilago hordei]